MVLLCVVAREFVMVVVVIGGVDGCCLHHCCCCRRHLHRRCDYRGGGCGHSYGGMSVWATLCSHVPPPPFAAVTAVAIEAQAVAVFGLRPSTSWVERLQLGPLARSPGPSPHTGRLRGQSHGKLCTPLKEEHRAMPRSARLRGGSWADS